MLFLAADTATRGCSVAVTDGDELLAEITSVSRETHSRHLLDRITLALKMAAVDLEEIAVFSVNRGPGSFTGLRIGLSTVKGLAEARKRPVVGVSGLEALAYQAGRRRVCAMIDALRSEVYAGNFEKNEGVPAAMTPPAAMSPENAIAASGCDCLFIGDGAVRYRQLIEESCGRLALGGPATSHIIRAGTIARIAHRQYLAGNPGERMSLMPLYLRASDAERNAVRQ